MRPHADASINHHCDSGHDHNHCARALVDTYMQYVSTLESLTSCARPSQIAWPPSNATRLDFLPLDSLRLDLDQVDGFRDQVSRANGNWEKGAARSAKLFVSELRHFVYQSDSDVGYVHIFS